MTSRQNERHLHVKVPQMMKQDLEAKAAKLGVSEAKLVRDALKAQGYGVRWSAPPPAAVSEERPDPLLGVDITLPRAPRVRSDIDPRTGFESRQRALRALMQPEA